MHLQVLDCLLAMEEMNDQKVLLDEYIANSYLKKDAGSSFRSIHSYQAGSLKAEFCTHSPSILTAVFNAN